VNSQCQEWIYVAADSKKDLQGTLAASRRHRRDSLVCVLTARAKLGPTGRHDIAVSAWRYLQVPAELFDKAAVPQILPQKSPPMGGLS
jgi:hypothetical protein